MGFIINILVEDTRLVTLMVSQRLGIWMWLVLVVEFLSSFFHGNKCLLLGNLSASLEDEVPNGDMENSGWLSVSVQTIDAQGHDDILGRIRHVDKAAIEFHDAIIPSLVSW